MPCCLGYRVLFGFLPTLIHTHPTPALAPSLQSITLFAPPHPFMYTNLHSLVSYNESDVIELRAKCLEWQAHFVAHVEGHG